jgi:hypothetical protein
MAHRCRRLERPQARKRHLVPCALDPRPVERRVPRAFLHGAPAVGQPQLGFRITAGFDEFEILAGRDRTRSEAVIAQEDLVARLLVVEGEGGSVVPALTDSPRVFEPAHARRITRLCRPPRRIGGIKGIREEITLDVHEQQLLVLLLVIEAEREARLDIRPVHRCAGVDQLEHMAVDVGTVVVYLLHRRARERVPLVARVKRPYRVVVRIENMLVARVQWTVLRQERLQQERFEKPRDVREVPLWRARVDDALDLVVVGLERRTEALRALPYMGVAWIRIRQRQRTRSGRHL